MHHDDEGKEMFASCYAKLIMMKVICNLPREQHRFPNIGKSCDYNAELKCSISQNVSPGETMIRIQW